MPLLSRLSSFRRNLFHKARAEKDLDDEVRAYLAMLVEEKIRAGMAPEQAHRAARIELGGVEQVKEQVRDIRAGVLLDTLWRDLRYGVRMLARSPGFTAVAVLALALGIGANTAIFSAVHAVLLTPLPYHDPDRLVFVWEDASHLGSPKDGAAPANYFDWKTQNQVFADMAAVVWRTADFTGDGPPEMVNGHDVLGNLFDVLGVRPLLGRTLTAADDAPSENVVIISHRLWQRRFGADPRIIGRPILMYQEKYTVVGVMPGGFHFLQAADYWVPGRFPPGRLASRGQHLLRVIARLKPGITVERAQSDMSAIAKRLENDYPEANRGRGARVVPFAEEYIGNNRLVLLVLLAAAGCVLLIACTNVANLLLARASARGREVALRMALGASRARLLRQMLTESLLLALLGAAAGALLGRLGLQALVYLVPDRLANIVHLRLDPTVLAFTLIVSVATGLLFGIAPAWQASRAALSDALKHGGSGGAGRGPARFRDALVVVEVGLAFVLLIGAGLLFETLLRLRAMDTGFRAGNVLTMRTRLQFPRYRNTQKRLRFFEAVLERVRSLPGVESAGFVNWLPYTSGAAVDEFLIEGRQILPKQQNEALIRNTAGDYLQAMGVRLREGRLLSSDDRADMEPVAVINETFARMFWPNESPLGKRVAVGGGPWRTIVGVIADLRERGLGDPLKPAMYLPVTQMPNFVPADLAIRSTVPPLSLANPVRQAIWEVDREQTVADVRTMEDILDLALSGRRQQMVLLVIFAGVALLLATVGIYGVLWYAVRQRTREIAVRMAVGAARGNVVRMIVAHGLRLTATGLVLGAVAALWLSRLITTLLYGVTATEPRTYALAAGVICAAAAAACLFPAARASRVDPVVALRQE
jgi:putative ABC transport system permease protein